MAFRRDNFIRDARQEGFSDSEISQELQKRGEEPITDIQPKGVMGFLSGLFPGAKKFGQTVGGTLGLKTGAQREAEESLQKAQQLQRQLIGRAKTAEPEKKERMLGLSRDISQTLGQAGEQQYATARQATGVKPGEEKLGRLGFAGKRGGQLAAEVGGWMFPTVGPAGKGAVPAITRSALTGAGTGGLMELAKEEPKPLKGALFGGGISAGMTAGAIGVTEVLGSAANKLSKLSREFGLKPEIGSELKSEEIAEFSLKAQEGKKSAGSYRKMKNWAKSVYKSADKKTKDVFGDASLGAVQVLGDDPRSSEWFVSNGLATADELYSLNKNKSGDKVISILEDFVDTGKLNIDDWVFLKKQGDFTASSIQRTAAKTGREVGTSGTSKRTQIAEFANTIRRGLRKSGGDKLNKFLKTQHYANVVKASTDAAAKNLRFTQMPKWFQLSAISGPALGGAFGYATGGLQGMGAGAVFGASPWLAYLTLQNPKVQNKMYDFAQKLTEKQRPTEKGMMLRKFLTGQAVGQ